MALPTSYDQAAAQYRAKAVETASPAALLLMLYDRAIGAVSRAQDALAEHGEDHVWIAHRELTRAQQIVSELQLSLDHEQGGAIASQLAGLYDYCLHQLTEANLRKDPHRLPPVAAILSQLREAFQEASTQLAELAELG